MIDIIKHIDSPIYYMGNKRRLLKSILPLFPNNIETYIELFCGSGVVGMNVSAKQYIFNDKNENLIKLLQYFHDTNPQDILDELKELITLYKLPEFSTDSRKYDGDTAIYKQNYNQLKKDYNSTKDTKLLYLLHVYSIAHIIRFNSLGDFNASMGNGYLTVKYQQNILDNNYSKISKLHSKDFRNVDLSQLTVKDFVYLDPPYYNSTAVYHENNGWTCGDDKDLFDLCDTLTRKGIKWGMSNVYRNRGKNNKDLIKWVQSKDYRLHTFENFDYVSFGKGKSQTQEVFITNY